VGRSRPLRYRIAACSRALHLQLALEYACSHIDGGRLTEGPSWPPIRNGSFNRPANGGAMGDRRVGPGAGGRDSSLNNGRPGSFPVQRKLTAHADSAMGNNPPQRGFSQDRPPSSMGNSAAHTKPDDGQQRARASWNNREPGKRRVMQRIAPRADRIRRIESSREPAPAIRTHAPPGSPRLGWPFRFPCEWRQPAQRAASE